MLFTSVLSTILLISSLNAAPHSNEQRLIKLSADQPAQWLSEADVLQLIAQDKHFMDITETPTLEKGAARRGGNGFTPAYPTTVTQQAVVKPMFALASQDLMRSVLDSLGDYNNRYYKSETGAKSADWLFNKVQEVATESNQDGHVKLSISQFAHSFPQKSIVARIEGKEGNEETMIVGAHLDSVNRTNAMEGRAPGKDDDGSGSVTILEIFKTLLKSGFTPRRPVEFHWYAGEEGGLLGSQHIAQTYKNATRTVVSMLQLDMTGFPNPQNPDVGIETTFVDLELNKLLTSCVDEYSKLKWANKACNYGCSDHASWNRAGYSSVYPFETSIFVNRNIHTENDTIVDYGHMMEFVKLGLGFVVEVAH